MIPFAEPDLTEREKFAMCRVLEKGWITSGPEMKAFEMDLANYCHAPEVICVNSATAGLHLALIALGIGPGDKVLVPTLTFAATAEVVKAVGATVVLCDVDPDTLCMTADLMAEYWEEGIRAVMPVSFAGQPLMMDEIAAFAKRNDAFVIEDAAHTFGTLYPDSAYHVGGHPDVHATVFSFYATKVITTGEGGAVCVNDPELAKTIRTLRLHGINRDAFDRYTSKSSGWEYDVVMPGWKYNMTDTAAAMGRVQLQRHTDMTQRRRSIAQKYRESLLGTHQLAGPGHVAHLHVVWGLENRNLLIEQMKGLGVNCSVHFKPLHRTTAYAETKIQFPVAEAYWHSCVSLPVFSRMTDTDVATVIAAFKKACQG